MLQELDGRLPGKEDVGLLWFNMFTSSFNTSLFKIDAYLASAWLWAGHSDMLLMNVEF